MATGLQSPARAGPNVSKSLKNEETETVYEFPPQSELLVLWAIRNGSSPGVYGLDIQRAIEESSSGNVNISVGTLYSMLKRLRKKRVRHLRRRKRPCWRRKTSILQSY